MGQTFNVASTETRFKRLRIYNLIMGFIHLAQAITIFLLSNNFSLMMEHHNQTTERINWTAYIFGCIAGITPWIVIAIYFFGTLSAGEDGVPTFVYFILPTLFVFFFSFALNMFLQYKRAEPWRDYLFGVRV